MQRSVDFDRMAIVAGLEANHHEQTILAFDVGGHGVRAGLVDGRTCTILRQADVPKAAIHLSEDPSLAFATLLRTASAALEPFEAGRVVIAAPGPVRQGKVSRLPTLFGHKEADIDLTAVARNLWPSASVWTCNDLTAAGFAFVAQGHRDFLVVTCGSGIGAKLFIEGRPLLGPRGMGGEIGHWQVDTFPSLPCDCGAAGHLAALASGNGIVKLGRHRAHTDPRAYANSAPAAECPDPGQLDTRRLVHHFHEQDPWTVALVDQAADALACAFALVHLAAAVDAFFVTGGFGTALGPRFGTLIAQHASERAWDTGVDWAAAIRVVSPDIPCGLVGGALYALSGPPENGRVGSS